MSQSRGVYNYILLDVLGHGNFGEVRLAEHVSTRKRYAVKTLRREVFDYGDYRIDARREMSILMALRHPNIISLYEVFVEGAEIQLVMELARNGDLFSYINSRGPLQEWQARSYFAQLIAAVLYCHCRGVYHRDLKPENLLLTDNYNKLKVADFGFAAVVDKHAETYPLLKTNCGSPHYCAPEVWNGEHEGGYDGRKSDAFSCGVVLYCMLTGIQPFHDSCEDLVLQRVNKCEFHFPSHVSPLAQDIIRGLLTRDPQRRSSLEKASLHPWMQDHHSFIPEHPCGAREQRESFPTSFGKSRKADAAEYVVAPMKTLCSMSSALTQERIDSVE